MKGRTIGEETGKDGTGRARRALLTSASRDALRRIFRKRDARRATSAHAAAIDEETVAAVNVNSTVNVIQEIVMKAKQLFTAAVAAFALSPLAALADDADELSKAWFAAQKSTRSVQEVRAEAREAENFGQQHPVEVQEASASMRSRADVKADLARHGVRAVGA